MDYNDCLNDFPVSAQKQNFLREHDSLVHSFRCINIWNILDTSKQHVYSLKLLSLNQHGELMMILKTFIATENI